jgi:hypothetical protein
MYYQSTTYVQYKLILSVVVCSTFMLMHVIACCCMLMHVRWKSSIVTTDSHTGEAGAAERQFEIRPEPVEGVTYYGPLEKYERKNLPHNMETSQDSIGISSLYENEREKAKPDD